jgi:hypothetical protein
MSRKRPAGQIQSSQMLEIASTLMPDASFTDGSIEALRVCQTNFLHQLAHELVALDKFSYTPDDVVDALTSMGMADVAQEALRRCCDTQGNATVSTAGESTITTDSNVKSAKPPTKARKKKAPKWNQEMEDEQERLLAQTKKEMEQQHMDASQA